MPTPRGINRAEGSTRRLLDLYLPTLAISLGQGMMLPAIPALAAHFRVTPGVAAQIVTAHAAGRIVALLPTGAFVDRLGPRAVLLIGSSCILAGAGALLLPAFWAVLAGQALLGVGSTLWTAGREVSGLGIVGAHRRGRLMSAFFGLQMAGLAVGPMAGGALVDARGLRSLFLAYAALALAIWILTALREWPGGAAGAAAVPPPSFGGLREIAQRDRATFAILVFATFAMSVYRMSLNSLLPLHAGVTLGLSATQVGALFGISSLGIFVMILPAGVILDRVGRKWAAVPAAAIPAVAFAAVPLARGPVELSILAAGLGLASGLSLGSISTFSYDVIPERAWGRLQALRRMVGEAGSLAGPLAGGILADAFSPAAAFVAFAPLLALTALLLAFGSRETLPRSAMPAA